MGIFDTTAKKIIDFLGMSSLGQKDSDHSLSIVPASDASFEIWHDGAMDVALGDPSAVYLGNDSWKNGGNLELNAAKPQPAAGFEVTSLEGDDLVAGDYDIRDTDAHYWVIPGYLARSLWIGIRVDLNQDMTCTLWGAGDNAGDGFSILATFAYTAGVGEKEWTMGAGAVGQGGTAGGATVATHAHYTIPAMAEPAGYFILSLMASGSAPASGSVYLQIAMRV